MSIKINKKISRNLPSQVEANQRNIQKYIDVEDYVDSAKEECAELKDECIRQKDICVDYKEETASLKNDCIDIKDDCIAIKEDIESKQLYIHCIWIDAFMGASDIYHYAWAIYLSNQQEPVTLNTLFDFVVNSNNYRIQCQCAQYVDGVGNEVRVGDEWILKYNSQFIYLYLYHYSNGYITTYRQSTGDDADVAIPYNKILGCVDTVYPLTLNNLNRALNNNRNRP